MTVDAGVAGHPILHSLSPTIHGAWIEAAGLDAVYGLYGPDNPERFAALLDHGRAGGLRGLNVTAPYKEQAFAAADEVSATARLVGSANLLVFSQGRILADSTDGAGVLYALAEQAPKLDLRDRVAVILGAGGASRAAAGALVSAGATVRIVNRTYERAEALAADVGPGVEAWAAGDAALEGAALIVNALTVQPDIDLSRLDPVTVVMDMTYRPLRTPLLAAAQDAGLTTVDGLAMLIGQAVPSFEAFFGQAPPDHDVRSLCLKLLGEAG